MASIQLENGNGYAYRKVHMLGAYLGLVLSVVLLMKDVFFAGQHEERIEEHLHFSDVRLDKLEAECARAKEIELQLQAQRDIQNRMEQTIDRQTQQIDSLQSRVRR